ncbi:hypothetical protein [Micromonospora rubida]|uniref:hypothetical protein n=1 Tax=Micromonospora rubida TaxID=2697657 RepID=UPI001378DDE0|nr:hypothetical protein [Micromonospora rubida]NBE82475.1 hypothetical protein [Micromonospora rubida]
MVDPHSPPPARTRPAVVTVSSYLLILFAAIQVIQLILTLTTIGKTRDVLRDAYSGTSANGADTLADFTFAIGIGSGILTLLLAVGLVVLALLNNRGRNGARITTWVLGGILACCTGGGLISGLAGGVTASGQTSGDMPSAEEIQRRLEEALPSWLTPVTTLLNVIALLALLAALILLALPKANEFFRKPQQGWEPPVPGTAYPAYPQTPGYPQAPGYPQSPGYPQAPGYPQTPGYPQSPGYPQAPGYPETPGYPQSPGHPQGPGQPGQPPASGPSSAPPSGGAADPGYPSQPGQPPAGGGDQPGGGPPSGPNPPASS